MKTMIHGIKVWQVFVVVFLGVALLLVSGCSSYYDKAYQEGYSAGESVGYESGYGYGELVGRDQGYDVGHYDGYWTGYEDGHDDGIASCDSTTINCWPSPDALEWRAYWRVEGIYDRRYDGALPPVCLFEGKICNQQEIRR